MALTQTVQTAAHTYQTGHPGYTSIEFHIQNMGAVYQSKIWEVPLKGPFFLVKEGSSVLAHLQTGDEIKARYTQVNQRKPGDFIKTRIRYIMNEQTGRFKGHYLVGLSLMEEQA